MIKIKKALTECEAIKFVEDNPELEVGFQFNFSKDETATMVLGNFWSIQIKTYDDEHLWYKYSNEDFWKFSKIEIKPMEAQLDDDDIVTYFLAGEAEYEMQDFLKDNI